MGRAPRKRPLTSWRMRVAEPRSGQMFLFSDDPVRCFETFAGVDEEFLKSLARFGLLSFDYAESGVTEERLLEVIFLKTVLRSGFPFDRVLAMLGQLEKPYRYDLSRMFWDLGAARWRLAPDADRREPSATTSAPTDIEGVITTLHDYASVGDRESLERVREAADRLLCGE